MRTIVGASLKSRLIVVALAVGLLVMGILRLPSMPVDALPEFTPPYVEVQTEALGLSAEEVEQLITVPMEQDLLNGVPWLKTIASKSAPGLSSILMTFEPGTDLMRARQMVTERMSQAFALPHVSKPPTMLQPTSSTGRLMLIGLSSKDVSMIQMGVLARWTIVPRLMGVPGVANVSIWGQRDRQLQVQVDPQRLKDQHVSLLQVLETAGNALWVSSLSFVEASTPGTGGFIDTAQQRLGIRHISPIITAEGLSQVPVEETDGKLKLSDVATVVEDHQPLIGDALTNDRQGLLLVVEKFPGANSLEVTQGVEGALSAMQPGLPGITIDTSIYRPASFIEQALNNLSLALIAGLVLMALALGALLFDWRAALIALAAIVVSFAAGAMVLYLRGATLNTMVLVGFAIAAGVVVDDAIVEAENALRRLRLARAHGGETSAAAILFEAALEMRGAMFYATLILLLAIAPVFFVQGLTGAFVQPLAQAYLLALLAAMVVALTLTPALCLLLLADAPAERGSPLAGWLQRAYERGLGRVVQRPRLMLAAVVLLTIAGVAVVPFLNQSLLPSFKERSLLVRLQAAPGTSQPEMSRIADRVRRDLRAIPGVGEVGAHVGRAVKGDQVVNVSSAELWVSIDQAANYDQTSAAIQQVVDAYPGIHNSLRTYLNERTGELAADQSSSALTVRVFGNTTEGLQAAAEQVKQAMVGVGGLGAARINNPVEQPTLQVEVDMAKAQNYGIKPGDVRRAAATLLSGIMVGNLFEEQKVFDVVVWGTPDTRRSLTSVRDLLIDTPSGEQVRLGDVASVKIVPSLSIIRHDAVRRYLDVSAEVRGRDLGAVAAEVDGRLKQIQFPLEYHAEVMGDYAAQRAAQIRLLVLAIAAAIAMFFLLQAAYGSWRLALLSFLTLPAALAGGLLAASAVGLATIGMLAGLLAVFGLAVRNQILLIKHYRHLTRYEGESFGVGLAVRGARDRVTPIVATALATALFLLPTLFLGDVPGMEVVRPMAIVVLGGLVSATLLNLFITPALYLALRVSTVTELELPHEEHAVGGISEAPLPL